MPTFSVQKIQDVLCEKLSLSIAAVVEQEFKSMQMGSADKGFILQDLIRQKDQRIQDLQAEVQRLKLERARVLSTPQYSLMENQKKDPSICLQVRQALRRSIATGIRRRLYWRFYRTIVADDHRSAIESPI
jgi:hypothetical protein